jgi:hypothetical protein
MKNFSAFLNKNVRSIIALAVVLYALNFFSIILVLKLGSPQMLDRMETSLTNLILFVLGYYFSANHNPNQAETIIKKEDEKSTTTTTTN